VGGKGSIGHAAHQRSHRSWIADSTECAGCDVSDLAVSIAEEHDQRSDVGRRCTGVHGDRSPQAEQASTRSSIARQGVGHSDEVERADDMVAIRTTKLGEQVHGDLDQIVSVATASGDVGRLDAVVRP
jgi:hypothetical protein